MSSYQRGKVVSIVVTVEYPDGSSKELHIDDVAGLKSLAFDPAAVPEECRDRYDVSPDDWRQNPSIMATYTGVDRANQFVPFCAQSSGACAL